MKIEKLLVSKMPNSRSMWTVHLRHGRRKTCLYMKQGKHNARRFARAFVAGMLSLCQRSALSESKAKRNISDWDYANKDERATIDSMIEVR